MSQDQDARSKVPFLRAHKVELVTTLIIMVLGVGLGMALPEDQSMPHKFNRIITVRSCLAACHMPHQSSLKLNSFSQESLVHRSLAGFIFSPGA